MSEIKGDLMHGNSVIRVGQWLNYNDALRHAHDIMFNGKGVQVRIHDEKIDGIKFYCVKVIE